MREFNIYVDNIHIYNTTNFDGIAKALVKTCEYLDGTVSVIETVQEDGITRATEVYNSKTEVKYPGTDEYKYKIYIPHFVAK